MLIILQGFLLTLCVIVPLVLLYKQVRVTQTDPHFRFSFMSRGNKTFEMKTGTFKGQITQIQSSFIHHHVVCGTQKKIF